MASSNKTRKPDEQVYVDRFIDLPSLLGRKSHFLFGPRQTGKTLLVKRSLPGVRNYDLLDTSVFLSLSRDPGRLAEEITPRDRIVVIDEIQRLPLLLNEAHRLIEDRRLRFLFTGSSARKLRRGGVNLLGGRARTLRLHPFTRRELGARFSLGRVMECGLLPPHYFSDDPRADLRAYVENYLEQEIMAEGAARNVPAFSRFLRVAAFCNGTIVNFTNLASDAQVARTTVYEYFDILKDTLIMHELPAWKRSKKRKPIASSKFYFCDVGVVAALQDRTFKERTPEFGEALETYVMHELVCHKDYVSGEPISFWRSTSGFEVDFIIGDHTAVEVKAKTNVGARDLKSLLAIKEERKLKKYVCVCLDPRPRTADGIEIVPLEHFLDALWDGAYRA